MNDTSLFDAVLKSLDKINGFNFVREDERASTKSGNLSFSQNNSSVVTIDQ